MPKLLDALAITTAQAATASTAVPLGTGSAGSLLVQIDFAYGSGGTSGVVYVQTSLDGGSTWIDIVNMTFLLASKSRLHNLTSRTAITTPYTITDGTLASDTTKDGVIGPVYRTKLTTVGTYAGGTTITVNVLPGA